MSEITFRAGDDLVERPEACDSSKGEVMRETHCGYLDEVRVYLDEVNCASRAAPPYPLDSGRRTVAADVLQARNPP